MALFVAVRQEGRLVNPSRITLGTLQIRRLRNMPVRLAQPHKRPTWNRPMNEHHELNVRQFAGRGLRYVAEWHGQWAAVVGWQSGVFQCKPRDQWLGWSKELPVQGLHLIGNDARFLPAGRKSRPNLGSYVLGTNMQRFSADWQTKGEWALPLELWLRCLAPPHRLPSTVRFARSRPPWGVET